MVGALPRSVATPPRMGYLGPLQGYLLKQYAARTHQPLWLSCLLKNGGMKYGPRVL